MRNRNYLLNIIVIRLFSRKNILLMVLLYCLIKIHLNPIVSFSVVSQCKISPWIYPLLISDANFLMLFAGGIIWFYSDIPFNHIWNSYIVLRLGREKWLINQLIYIIVSAFIIPLEVIGLTWIAIFPRMEFQYDWGKIIYTLANTSVGSEFSILWKISPQYIEKYNALEAMLMGILISGLGIAFMGILMFAICLIWGRICGLISESLLVAFSSVAANVIIPQQQLFHMLSPVSYMRVGRIGVSIGGYQVMPSIIYIVWVYTIGTIICSFIGYLRIKRMNLKWKREKE